MGRVAVGARSSKPNNANRVVVAIGVLFVTVLLLAKMKMLPSEAEAAMSGVQLMVPLALLISSGLRREIGVSRRFALIGLICSVLGVASRAVNFPMNIALLLPAYTMFVWMLGNCWKEKGIDSGWAGLALCFIMAPIF